MIQGVSEIAAMCVGLVGLIGAAATTGMPMWKVTAFIGENIIVMETRWEGLWMNCYRQANIRMQCKVYDSLLYLPPELQAARGLMCCSVALSGLGLLVALTGMRCISCFSDNKWAKTIILMTAGAMQFLACICVFIPVSWTGHVIIRDFYNPLLIDAQRRELGEALYIGWVTGAFLFASALLFVCRRMPSDKGSFDVYHPVNSLRYQAAQKPNLMRYHPISSVSSISSDAHQNFLRYNGSVMQEAAMPLQNVPQLMPNNGSMRHPSVVYNPSLPENASLYHQGSLAPHSSLQNSFQDGNLYAPGNSLYMSRNITPYTASYIGNPTVSYQSSFHPVPQGPVFITYKESRIHPETDSGNRTGVYI
ncbi:claudin-8-like [Melanotaenia boesemani]|uniref:claudin-8-like n=1 Tax=Melanotaenia boesemani TaxID=1250792 RepID=UPI001C047887|nr:claudin-8-like [Melanotaenia boesemani]XP_041850985.1 claudin-8-like [Melanotaenia boesemani]